jgi:hypothetical protein
MRLLTTMAIFSVVTWSTLVAVDSRQQAASGASDSPLGLKVMSKKQQVEIRWNHDLGTTLKASKALMKISEGEITQALPLNQRDLQDGFVAYTPLTNDVRVRFEVTVPDGTTVSETARVVAIP